MNTALIKSHYYWGTGIVFALAALLLTFFASFRNVRFSLINICLPLLVTSIISRTSECCDLDFISRPAQKYNQLLLGNPSIAVVRGQCPPSPPPRRLFVGHQPIWYQIKSHIACWSNSCSRVGSFLAFLSSGTNNCFMFRVGRNKNAVSHVPRTLSSPRILSPANSGPFFFFLSGVGEVGTSFTTRGGGSLFSVQWIKIS